MINQKTNPWPDSGFVRLSSILAPSGPLPISRSSWWAGVASGRYPKPVKLGPRITAWRVTTVTGNAKGHVTSYERSRNGYAVSPKPKTNSETSGSESGPAVSTDASDARARDRYPKPPELRADRI